jgi:nitroreductase
MEVYEAIERRRTIRSFSKNASEEQLRKIISAGAKAPSGGNSQPWEFIIVDDPAIVEQLAELKYQLNRKFRPRKGEGRKEVEQRALNQKKSFQNASVVAVCCESEGEPSAWLCIENMSLAAVAEGLGSGIVAYWDRKKRKGEKILGLPKDYELVAVMKIGMPEKEAAPPSRRPEFSWLHKNRFPDKVRTN